MLTRRELLKRSALLSLAPMVPSFVARTARAATPKRDARILVVVQLDGGNDGLNTVIPFADENYARHRRELRLPRDRILKLDDQVGLHPSMRAAADLVDDGRLAIVQGVGYPNPNRSHFRSTAVWHTARLEQEHHDGPGWIGRALDAQHARDAGLDAIHIGREDLPRPLRGRRTAAASFADAADLSLLLDTPPVPLTSAGTDLSAFVHRTLAHAYTTAAQLAAPAGRSGIPSCSFSAIPERWLRPLSRYGTGKPARTRGPLDQGRCRGTRLLRRSARLRHARRPTPAPRPAAARLRRCSEVLPRRPRRGGTGRPNLARGLQRVRPPRR